MEPLLNVKITQAGGVSIPGMSFMPEGRTLLLDERLALALVERGSAVVVRSAPEAAKATETAPAPAKKKRAN